MMNPLEDGTTQIHGTVFKKRSKIPVLGKLIDKIGLETRRWFTGGYLNDENIKLGNPVYRPSTLVEQDEEVIAYFHWALALSRHAASL